MSKDNYISKKISILRKEGYPQKQSIAIAHNYARKKGLKEKRKGKPLGG